MRRAEGPRREREIDCSAQSRRRAESLRLQRGFQLEDVRNDLLAGINAGENLLFISVQRVAGVNLNPSEAPLAGGNENPVAVVQVQNSSRGHKSVNLYGPAHKGCSNKH